jgi:hypothetical protein
MSEDEALAQVYYAASGIATDANTSKGMPSAELSARLAEGNRKLQEALRDYEFARGEPER